MFARNPLGNIRICLRELKRDNEYLIAKKSLKEGWNRSVCLHINFESIIPVHFEAICYARHVNKAVDGKQICESRNLFWEIFFACLT